MDFSEERGPYKTNIDRFLRSQAHFFGPNAPKMIISLEQVVLGDAERLLSQEEARAEVFDNRPFSKSPPRLIGEAIDLVRDLPPYDSLEFKLLHPLTIAIDSEETTPIDIERGIRLSAAFAQHFNSLFEKSTEKIRANKRRGASLAGIFGLLGDKVIGPADSCSFWGGEDLDDNRSALTDSYWELVLHRDRGEVKKRQNESWDAYFRRVNDDDDYSELTMKSMEFESTKFDLGPGLILSEMEISPSALTMDRVGRFGLPQRLADFLMQEPMGRAAERMSEVYEAFYLLQDTAYLAENGLTEVTLSRERRTQQRAQLIIEQGNLRQRRSLFWTAIADDDVRAEQIRTCKILDCRKVFWAKAKNQWCCSPRCSNLYHVQNYRYKTPEQKAAYVERQIRRERGNLKPVAGKKNGNGKGELKESVPFKPEPPTEN